MSGFFYMHIPSKLHYICIIIKMYMFLFISGGEILFILLIVVMVFGADKIPEIARGLGKGMRQLKEATNEIKYEIQKSAEKQGIDTDLDIGKDLTKELNEEVGNVKKEIEDVTGSIKRKL